MHSTIGHCLLALSLLAIARTAQASDNKIQLSNEALRVTIDGSTKGSIQSIIDVATGTEFIASQAAPRLFTLTLSRRGEAGAKPFYLSSRGASDFSMALAAGTATLHYTSFGSWPINVTCTATVSQRDRAVQWRFSAEIPDSLVLEAVQFPQVVLCAAR